MKFQDALSDYLTQAAADGRSVHTQKQYARHTQLFVQWLRDVGASDEIAAVDHKTVARFFVSPTAKTTTDGRVKRAGTVNAIRASLSGFFRFLHDAGLITENPTRLLRRAICGRPEPRAMETDDQPRFLAALDTASNTEERRDRALFTLMLTAGLRLGSAIGLDIQDLDLERRMVRLRKMKGDREGRAFVPEATARMLRDYIGERRSGAVFLSWTGKRISHRHSQRRFQLWVRRAGIERSVRPHGLRHAFAKRIYESTGDIVVVKEALGHASVVSTLVYGTATDARIRAAIDG
jgi:site-specific recombinase XerC